MSNPSKLQLLDNLRLAIENRSMSSVITIYKLMVKQYGQEEGHRMMTERLLRMSEKDLDWFNQQQQQQQSNSYGSRSFFK